MKNLVLIVQALMLLAVACGPIAVYANSGGNTAFKSGNYGSALRNYERAQALAPDQMELLYNTGNALYRQRDFGEARERFQDVLVSADEDMAKPSLFNLGNAYFNAFQFEDAVEAYKEVLRIDPSDQSAKHNLELALNQLQGQTALGNNEDNPPEQPPEQQEPDPQQSQQPETGPDQPDEPDAQVEREDTPILNEEQARQLLDSVNQNTESLRGHLQRVFIDQQGPPPKDW
ncbi:MAG: tetratricopeptide repeat protein [Chloroflexi bacterium]|nr:tetratricopeptide repeat protein [Chloroflexota bacterium]MDA1226692.1 tetratricopeptide repeat protein [Chloroflexota bacterium]